MQKWPGRRIDRKCAHHVVELPGLLGLDPVVAVDAALIAGDRRVDRAKGLVAADLHKPRHRHGVRFADKGFDDLGHMRVRGGCRDRSPGPPDPLDAHGVFGAARTVEQRDRVGPKGCRNRRPFGVEFLAQVRVIADEGIDELQRGGLLVGLVFDKGVQAGLIEPVSRDNGKRDREKDDPDQPGAFPRSEKGHYCSTSRHHLLSPESAYDGVHSLNLTKRRVAQNPLPRPFALIRAEALD